MSHNAFKLLWTDFWALYFVIHEELTNKILFVNFCLIIWLIISSHLIVAFMVINIFMINLIVIYSAFIQCIDTLALVILAVLKNVSFLGSLLKSYCSLLPVSFVISEWNELFQITSLWNPGVLYRDYKCFLKATRIRLRSRANDKNSAWNR